METKNFLGLDGLKRFWEKAKLWIINEITTKIAGIVLSSVPVGTVLQGLYTTVPNGFLLCNGQEVAIASFHKLYTEIGSLACCQSSNAGKFKIPDLRGRFLEGANGNLGIYIEAGLPNITASARNQYVDWNLTPALNNLGGAFCYGGTLPKSHYTGGNATSNGNYHNDELIVFNASLSNSIYGKSTTVQPRALCVNYIIKY